MGWRWRYNTARAKVDWDKILEAIKERHTELEEFGVDRFTPRFVHYYLKQSRTDLGLFNVKSDKWKPYPRLIDHLTAWRKSGDLPNEWFYDDKRHDADQMPSLTPE